MKVCERRIRMSRTAHPGRQVTSLVPSPENRVPRAAGGEASSAAISSITGASPTRINHCGIASRPVRMPTILRLDDSSIRCVSVHVAIPANVHSNNTADNTSPDLNASLRVSPSVETTSTVESSSGMPARRSEWRMTGKARPTSTRSLSAADTSEVAGIPSIVSKWPVHHSNSEWYDESYSRSDSVSCDASASCGRSSSAITSR